MRRTCGTLGLKLTSENRGPLTEVAASGLEAVIRDLLEKRNFEQVVQIAES